MSIGGVALYLDQISRRNDKRRLSWPTTKAIVLSSDVEFSERLTGGSGRSPNALRRAWEVRINYEYEVDGVKYTGDSISNNPPVEVVMKREVGPSEFLTALRDRYPKGSTPAVHYDPKTPSQSFLHFRPTAGLTLPLVAGGFSLLGALLFFLGLSRAT